MMIKKLVAFIIIGLILAYLVYLLIPGERSYRGIVVTDNAYVAGEPVEISTLEAGRIVALHILDYQPVSAGDLIAEIDAADLELELARFLMLLQQREIALSRVQARSTLHDEQIRKTSVRLDGERRILELESRELKRALELSTSGHVSNGELDRLKATLAVREVSISDLENELQLLRLEQDTIALELDDARNAIELARNDVEKCNLRLSRTKIYADVSGRIGRVHVNQGASAEEGELIASIIRPSKIFVKANFKETELAHLKIGCPMSIRLDSHPKQLFEGRIQTFAPTSASEFSFLPREPGNGNFIKFVQRVPVKIEFEDSAAFAIQALKPGVSAVVRNQKPCR